MTTIPKPRLKEHSVRGQDAAQTDTKALPFRLAAATSSTAMLVGLILKYAWAWNWLYSGAAVLSQFLIYDQARQIPSFPSTRPWLTLATFNLIYAITSTSWLQYYAFTGICWMTILFTFVSVAPGVSSAIRAILRPLFSQAHLTNDVIAGFDLPALHLDVGLDGLLTIRGWTLSLSTMTIELHGVEAAYNLTDTMHVAMYCDGIAIKLCRCITIGAIYCVLKQETFAVELGKLSQPERGDCASFIPAEGKIIGDVKAHNDYSSIRKEIWSTSPIHLCREQTVSQEPPQLDEKIRAAMCEKLQDYTSVPHRPEQFIKVSRILQYVPMWIRRFFSRMPLLLRLILMPLSYFHPIKTASASFSASGSWMADITRDKIYSIYGKDRDDIQELEQTMTDWMKDAMFCMDLADIQFAVDISARSSQTMVAYPRCGNSTMLRNEAHSNKFAPAISIKGMDATFTIPSYFLPSHEHLLPPRPSDKEETEDQAEIDFAFHISLPIVVDGAMIDFATDFANATIAMEMEDIEDEGKSHHDDLTNRSKADRAKIKLTTAARNVGKSMHKGMKKAAFSSGCDSWIPQSVGRAASYLEGVHGKVGYSGSVPVPLRPFRGSGPSPTKLLA